MKSKLILLVGALLPLAGCASNERVPLRHIVMFDGDGLPVDPASEGGRFASYTPFENLGEENSEYETHLQGIVEGMRESGLSRILLHVHGGLNTQAASVHRARELTPLIMEAGYYPIFLNWQSSLLSSYRDHLLFIRQGRDWGAWSSVFAPVFLAADLARGLTRAPFVWTTELQRFVSSVTTLRPPLQRRSNQLIKEWERKAGPSDEPLESVSVVPFQRHDDERRWTARAWSGAKFLITLPVKLAVSPFVDSFGTSSWEVMERRTHLLFETEESFIGRDLTPRPASGLPRFLEILAGLQDNVEHQLRAAAGPDVSGPTPLCEIRVVGHSMGAIVINDFLRRSLEDHHTEHSHHRYPRVDHIQYMAPACSIRSFRASVVPYLLHHPETRCSIATLHPKAEMGEDNALDLAPRGSLLTWVDAFLNKPATLEGRTLGDLNNLVFEVHNIPPQLRQRIQVKAFGLGGEESGPQKHGEFDDPQFCFWGPEFFAVPGAQIP